MSANLSCYSKKYEQPRIEKIKSIISDVKESIGPTTTLLAGLAEEQLAKLDIANNDVDVKDVKDMKLMEVAINSSNPSDPSDSSNSSNPSLASSPAASEAQEQGQVVASSKEASTQISKSLTSITKDPSVANITSLSPSKSSTAASSTATKREKSPYVLTIGDISYQLCYGESYIGRDQSNQIIIDDFHISRLHALVVVHSNNKVAIFDLGSLNRTFVNGRMITCAALEVGDNIKLGSYYQLTLNLSVELGQLTDSAIDSDDHSNSSLIN
ncbi:MAG: FHA domain-containing protein [Blastocatellia bacterium]